MVYTRSAAADSLAWLAVSHGYEVTLKVPCPAVDTSLLRQADLFTSTWYFPLAGPGRPFVPSGATVSSMGYLAQDLMLLDVTSDPRLYELLALGRKSCRSPARSLSSDSSLVI